MTPTIAALVGAVFVLFVVLVIVTSRMERNRTEALRRVAETAGLAFEPKGNLEALRLLGDVQLFGRGHSRRVANLMTGRLDDQQVAVFDYWYTTGSGKSQHTAAQTVVLLPSAKNFLPDLQMAPENPITRIAEAFGYQDIDIDSSPEFSRRYIVRGADETAIRAALHPGATSYFAEHEGWTVEVQSGTVGIYRNDSRPKAVDMRTFIEDARAAARSL
jgi:carbonic anhydrase